MKQYHVHMYFEVADQERAKNLCTIAEAINIFEVVKLQEKSVGPHPSGMIEMHFSEPDYNKVVSWLHTHRGHLTAMIHEDTGDDYRDHTDGIHWLGEPLPLDFSFFDLIIERPELRINP